MYNLNVKALNPIDKEYLEKHLNSAMEILNKYPCKDINDKGEIADIPIIKSYIENARVYCRQLAVR